MKDMLIAGGRVLVQVIKCIAAHSIVCQHIDCNFRGGATGYCVLLKNDCRKLH